jgi:multimeric flavodoxin WrbA
MLVPKILGISGSLRGKEGNSDKMLREFMGYVERYGGEPEIIRLTDMNILTCEGCASKTKDKLA